MGDRRLGDPRQIVAGDELHEIVDGVGDSLVRGATKSAVTGVLAPDPIHTGPVRRPVSRGDCPSSNATWRCRRSDRRLLAPGG